MNEPKTGEKLGQALFTMRIITTAMLLSTALFMGVAVFLRTGGRFAQEPEMPILTYAAIGVGVTMIALRLIVPGIIINTARRQLAGKESAPLPQGEREKGKLSDDGAWATLWMTTSIIGLALTEAPTLFLLVAYLLEGQTAALAVAALGIAGLAIQMPSRHGIDTWIEDQKRFGKEEQ